MNNLILPILMAQAQILVAQQGGKALDATERVFTIPEKEVRSLCKGYKMTPEATEEALRLSRVMADAMSDFTVFTASHGMIQAD